MKRFRIALAVVPLCFSFGSPAFCQSAPPSQPSDKALILVLHQELQQANDGLTMAQARIADLEQQIAAAKVLPSKPVATKGH
jgi:hypothetical protein